jgi:hypothetical protein
MEWLHLLARDAGMEEPQLEWNKTQRERSDLLRQILSREFDREMCPTGPMDDATFLTEYSIPVDGENRSTEMSIWFLPCAVVRVSNFGNLATICDESFLPSELVAKLVQCIKESRLIYVPSHVTELPSPFEGESWFYLFFQYF